MTDRITRRFESISKSGAKAFVPFTVLGWPDRKTSFEIIKTMIAAGASALELGIAFSDPVADGVTIQKASFETLSNGFKVADAMSLIKDVRKTDAEIPIGVLVYYNLVLAMGADEFCRQLKEAGADSALVADLPAESADEVLPSATKYGIKMIFLVSPLTSEKRLDLILKNAQGFIYLVSRLGVTGSRERQGEKDRELMKLIAKIKERSKLPVLAGFGISQPEDAKTMIELGADGVITGSRVIEVVRAASKGQAGDRLRAYLTRMVEAVTGHASVAPGINAL